MAKSQTKSPKVVRQHAFRSVRDPIVLDATQAGSGMVALVTNATGGATLSLLFSPFGVYSLSTSNVEAGKQVVFGQSQVTNTLLPWLYNQSRNFERYRVTRAVIIAVGNVGSTATGRLMMDSSTDFTDATTPITLGTSTGGKVWDVANMASKELRFALDVDSSWKKVSRSTFIFNPSGTVATPVNTVNDLSFSTAFISCVGASAGGTVADNTTIANFYLEYDVEFKDPISFGVNQ